MQLSLNRSASGVSVSALIFRMVLAALIALALGHANVNAQALTGSLTGTVTDASEAVIPGANVTITNLGTGKTNKESTNAEGVFTFAELENGNFKVTVEHAGFSTTVIERVQVFVSQSSHVNVKLEVARTGTEVVVQAEQTAVQTDSVELKDTVERKELDSIPLPTRNPLDLVKTFAGVLTPNAGSGITGGDAFVHGMRGNDTNLTQDGINVQDNTVKTSAFFALSAPVADTIGEMNVSVGGIGADAGFGGAQVSMITVRGTNDFHGSAYWYQRTDDLNANTWFNNAAGVTRPFQLQNHIGGTFGGPVWLPKIYKGRNRTFFFVAYEAYREPRSQPETRTVITPNAEQGLFTYTPSGTSVPVTVNLLNIGTIGATGQKPTINPAFANVYEKYVPTTGLTNTGCAAGDTINVQCYAFNGAGVNNQDRYTVRADHQLTSKHAIEFVWNRSNYNTAPDFLNSNAPPFPTSPWSGGQQSQRQVYVWALQSVFTPTQTNEFRVGYQTAPVGFNYNNTFTETGGNQIAYAGVTSPIMTSTNFSQGRNTPTRQIIDNYAWVKGNHQMRFGGEYRLLLANTFVDDRTFPVVTLGSNSANPNNLSATTLPGISAAELTIANNIFNDITGLLGSIAEGVNHTSPTSGYVAGVPEQYTPIQQNMALYWQDLWKIKRNFSVQYGVRWEYQGPYDVRNGLILLPQNGVAGVFGPTPVGGYFSPGNVTGATDSLLTLQGSTASGNPTTQRNWRNFAPFIGITWSPGTDSKTVVRASFSTHFVQDGETFYENATTLNTGLFTTLSNTTPTGVFSPTNVPLPPVPASTFPVSQVNNYYNVSSGSASELAYAHNLRTPYVMEWSLGIQRELWKKYTIEARYVGNHAPDQFNLFNINETDFNYNGLLQEFDHAQANLQINTANKITGFANNGLPGQFALPILSQIFTGVAASSGFSNSTYITDLNLNNIQAMWNTIRNSPTYFTNIKADFPSNFFVANPWAASAYVVNNSGWSYWDGLEVEVKRRFGSGFFMQANYTFSKGLSNAQYGSNQSEQQNYQSLLNTGLDKVREGFDVRHSFGMTFLYPLPIGRGRQFANNMPKVLNVVAGGWSVTGFTHWSSGAPLSGWSSNRSTIQSGTSTPLIENMTASQLAKNIGVYEEPTGVYYLNPALGLFTIKGGSSTVNYCTAGQTTPCFGVPGPGQFGNITPNSISGPHFFDQDAALVKDTRIWERINFQIRLEGFDVFNNVNFASAQVNTDSTSFGQLTSTFDTARGGGVTARIVQWAARVTF
jgi:hypothetical protein